MNETEHFSWRSVLASLLWLVVTLGGLTLIMPILTILFGVGVLMGSGDPTASVMDKYRIVSARHFGIFIYGAVWLGGIIALNSYFQRAKTVRALLVRFALVAAVEGAVWGLGLLVQELTMS